MPVPRILLTGFDTFGDVAENPSERIVAALSARPPSHCDLIPIVLPTAYLPAQTVLRRLIVRHRPDAVVCLGVAREREGIQLERIALNLDDADCVDNRSVRRAGRTIVRGAPLAYASTLPLQPMLRALRAKGIAASISNHAGTFLCNHVFFVARHLIESHGLNTPCGFIHVPMPAHRARTKPSLKQLTSAIETCLAIVSRRARSG